MPRTKEHLVLEHLESIRADVFEQFQKVITGFVDQRNGIYALYHGDRLYYVGLASNMRSRLKAHLRDRHKGLWDRFSVYLTNGDAHIKELESLMLRVVKPEGNRVKGKLTGSKDKRRELDRLIKQEQDNRRYGILGTVRKVRKAKAPKEILVGKPWVQSKSVPLRTVYKGLPYRATLRKDGKVRYKGVIYPSLSAAGKAVRNLQTNGRYFWMMRNEEGNWIRISKLFPK